MNYHTPTGFLICDLILCGLMWFGTIWLTGRVTNQFFVVFIAFVLIHFILPYFVASPHYLSSHNQNIVIMMKYFSYHIFPISLIYRLVQVKLKQAKVVRVRLVKASPRPARPSPSLVLSVQAFSSLSVVFTVS